MIALKILLLTVLAPRFWRDMPPPQEGAYFAEVSSVSPWYEWTRFSYAVQGRRKAYLVARWEALKLDYLGEVSWECAIRWRVRRVKEEGAKS